jgi:uncharacterized protein YndB with AHSA1/START domain
VVADPPSGVDPDRLPSPPRRGSVRMATTIERPADEVWAVAGDPARLAEWFPGITACTVAGSQRTVTTTAGTQVTEELLVVDPLQRRLQYRIVGGLLRSHAATIDVHDLGDGTSLVVHATDAEPATMAVVLGGAAGDGLDRLRHLLEAAR